MKFKPLILTHLSKFYCDCKKQSRYIYQLQHKLVHLRFQRAKVPRWREVSAGTHSFCNLRTKLASLLFPASKGLLRSLSPPLLYHCSLSASSLSLPTTLTHLPSSFKDLCDYIGTTQLFQANLHISSSLVQSTKSFHHLL